MERKDKKQTQREIRIEPLVGFTEEGDEVQHAMDQIFLNGIRVGYVGHKDTDAISIIRPGVMKDEPTLEAIRQAIQREFKEKNLRRVSGAPQLTSEETLDLAEGIGVGAEIEPRKVTGRG